MESAITSKQKSVLGLLLPIFEGKAQIESGQVTQEYQRLTRQNLSLRVYGFQGNDDLINKLNVFDCRDGAISLSKLKLFDLLVRPLLTQHSPHELESAFETNNGFEPTILCRYCKVESLLQLVAQYTSYDSSAQVSVDAFRPFPVMSPYDFATLRSSSKPHFIHDPFHGIGRASAPSLFHQAAVHPIAAECYRPQPTVWHPQYAPPRPVCHSNSPTEFSNRGIVLKEAPSAVSSIGPREKSVLRLLLPFFEQKPQVPLDQITQEYQQLTRSNFSSQLFGFRSNNDMIAKLDVFDQHDGSISLSESKLLNLLVHPFLANCQLPVEQAFKTENGFESAILCHYCKVKSLQQLMKKCRSSGAAAQPNSPSLVPTTEPVTNTHFPPVAPTGASPPQRVVQAYPQKHTSAVSSATASHQMMPQPLLSQAHPSSLLPCHPIEHHPNSNISLREETYLPVITSVQPDMEIPTSSQRSIFPSFSWHDTKKQAQEKLEVYMQNQIDVLSSKHKHLPAELVFNISSDAAKTANNMLSSRSHVEWKDIKSSFEFIRRYERVFEFIRCFCWNTTITSLFELQKAILILEDCTSFDDLQMGPILTHPVVKDLFKPPADLHVVPEVTAYDIQTKLATFIHNHEKGTTHNFLDFLNYLAKQLSVSDPSYLCIRVRSFPFALHVNFRYRAIRRQLKNELQDKTEKELEKVVDFEFEKFRRKLERMLASDERELLKKDPVVILEGIMEASMQVFDPYSQSIVTNFIQLVLQRKVLRQLFLAAIYQGAYGVQKLALEQSQQTSHPHGLHHFQPNQSSSYFIQRGDVTCEILKCLKTVPSPVDLNSLSRVEEGVAHHFGVQQFGQLGQGPFLKFITSQRPVLSALGGDQIGSNVVNRLTQEKVVSFIQQLRENDKDLITHGIMWQFCSSSVEVLQCGTVEKLLTDAQQQRQTTGTPAIAYQVPLLVDKEDSQSILQHGLLGPQTPNDALCCLKQAPMLEDLAYWSHWDLVYAPYLGDLGKFLTTHARDSVYALELSPGRLVRIEATSSVAEFVKAVKDTNPVKTAGHLVTMVVRGGSVHTIPTQLLANHVRTKLEELATRSTGGDDALGGHSLIAQFIFSCLIRMPFQICRFLASEVFITPLRKVTNTAVVDGLLRFCRNHQDRLFLQALGMAIGNKHWADDFKEMQQHPESTSGNLGKTVPLLHTQPINNEKESATLPLKNPESINASAPRSPCDLSIKNELASINESTSSLSSIPSEQECIERESQCKAIIMNIRRDEFGYEIKLKPKQEEIFRKHREREGRSLKRLSQELYSKDTHFVLELVQNADDNSYPPHFSAGNSFSMDVPTLKFILFSDCIVVCNNESGFTEQNIRAVCNVGKSTKGPRRSGYIGQKGIGFKSVFRVTDTPEIHSNCFHIRFDTQSGPIGYILPHWVERSFIENMISSEELKQWTTRIVLPLKPANSKTQTMVNKFRDIHPSLLLFLNRLRCIAIEDRESGRTLSMRRENKEQDIITLYHNDGTDTWLVVRRVMMDADQYKPGVDTTELALAFPLPENLQSPPSARELQIQQVFAFLPLRSYGFRFIVQADFDLPSSREDVNTDSAWNQWLREEIPSLFLEALDKMKGLPELSAIAAVALFLQFVPLKGEVHDFFKPVTGQILQLLQGKQCLPTDFSSIFTTNDDPFGIIIDIVRRGDLEMAGDQVVDWQQPSQLLKVSNKLIRWCIPQSLLYSNLGLSYLNSSLHHSIGEELASQLGIGSITVQHLITVAKEVLDGYSIHKMSNFRGFKRAKLLGSHLDVLELEEELDQEDPHVLFVRWVANWLACVCAVMDDTRDVSSASINSLKGLPILPLSDNSLTSLDNGPLFFHKELNDKEFVNMDVFRPVFDSLKVIDPRLMHPSACYDQMVPVMIKKILTKLEVRELLAQDIIHYHIIPRLTEEETKDSDKQLIVYLAYIKDAIDKGIVSQSQMVTDLKESLILVTNKGHKVLSKKPVHFDFSYKTKWNLLAHFPDVQWTIISPAYLSLKPLKANEMSTWIEFLSKLGVQDGLAIERIDEMIDTQGEGKSYWRDFSDWKRSADGRYVIRDYCCREFDGIIRSMEGQPSQISIPRMAHLAKLLDESWNEYGQYILASYHDSMNTNELGKTMSSFGHSLCTLSWLPTCSPSISPLLKGTDLYQDSVVNRRILHHHVPYLAVELTNSDLLKHLGVNVFVSEESLLEYLQKWAKPRGGEPFCTSIEHMRNVYLSLYTKSAEYAEGCFIVEAFRSGELVFVPLANNNWKHITDNTDGHFYSVHNLCWQDRTKILCSEQMNGQELPSHLPRVLSLYYHYDTVGELNDRIQKAFCHFGVKEGLNIQSLIDVLEFNASRTSSPETRDVEFFQNIAKEVVATICTQSQSFGPACEYMVEKCGHVINQNLAGYFLGKVKNLKVFPSQGKKWVTLKGLYVNNNDEIARKFAKTEEIHFLQWPSERGLELPNDFTQLCNMPELGSCVSLRISPGSQVRQSDELRKMLYHMIPLIQRYLFSKHPNEHEHLEHHRGIAEYLENIQVLSTLGLKGLYVIEVNGKEFVSEEASIKGCILQDDSSTLYVVTETSGQFTNKLSLVDVFLQLFFYELGDITDARSFLTDLVVNNPQSEEAKSDIAERFKVSDLPEGSKRWNVKPPRLSLGLEPAEESDEVSDIARLCTENDEEDESVESTDNSSLKAWPQRNFVHSMNTQRRPRKHDQTFLPSLQEERQITRDNVITLKDIKTESRQAEYHLAHAKAMHLQKDRSGEDQQGLKQQPCTRDSFASSTTSEQSRPFQSRKHSQEVNATQEGNKFLYQKDQLGNVGADRSPTTVTEQTGLAITQKVSVAATAKKKRGGEKHWVPMHSTPDFANVQSVDISDLMATVTIDVSLVTGVELLQSEGAQGQASKEAVGRWGERFIYNYLLKGSRKLPNGKKIVEVHWMNEEQERGGPYDITVLTEEKETCFVEVKATSSLTKEFIPISWRELKFAEEKKECYFLYRLYNAGKSLEEVQLKCLQNLFSHLKNTPTARLYLTL